MTGRQFKGRTDVLCSDGVVTERIEINAVVDAICQRRSMLPGLWMASARCPGAPGSLAGGTGLKTRARGDQDISEAIRYRAQRSKKVKLVGKFQEPEDGPNLTWNIQILPTELAW